jgi:acyl-CoA reductase-like NAD-dependent aldehyde dehydrogenase
VAGGGRAPRFGSDLFYEATVLEGVTEEMEIAREETFGPVAPVSTILSEAKAIEAVNGSPYGLLRQSSRATCTAASSTPKRSEQAG